MNRIRELRKKARLTQGDVALKCGTTDSAVSRWELGSNDPNEKQLHILAELFNVSIDYLLNHDSFTQDEINGGISDNIVMTLNAEEHELILLIRDLNARTTKPDIVPVLSDLVMRMIKQEE